MAQASTIFRRWVEVRPDERRAVAVSFVTLFAMVGAHSILETARDTLFLAKIPADELPIAYLAIALLVAFTGQLTGYLRKWVSRGALLPSALVICALLTAAFWVAVDDAANDALLFALYIWSGLVGTFVVGLFWLRLGDLFDVGQAKRLFTLAGTGGVAGATVGSIAARGLLESFDPQHLILAAAACYFFAALWVAGVWRGPGPDGERTRSEYERRSEGMSRWEILRREPYLVRLSLLIAVSMITVTLVDYLFKSTVAAEVPPEQLGNFFATYYAVINGVSAVVQLVIAPLLLGYLGVNRALVLFPGLLLAGGIGLATTGTMAAALLLKGVDGSLRHSLYRTGMEILYLPLSADVRSRFKALLDGLAQRGGQAVASLVILLSAMAGLSRPQLAYAVLGLALVWLVLGWRMRGSYLNLFRERLSLGQIDPRAEIPDLDLSAMEQLLAALNSPEDDTVITALDMFHLYRRGNLVPALILYHPSSRVVDKASEVLAHADRDDVSAVAARLLQHDNPTIRAAALRLLVRDRAAFAEHEAQVKDSDDPVLQGMIVVGRWNAGRIEEDEAQERLATVFEEASADSLCGLAQAIRGDESPLARWALIQMTKRADSSLAREVADGMAAKPHPDFLPYLVDLLPSRAARPSVRRALVRLGDPALKYLEDSALESRLPRRLMRHLPRSISPFGGQAAVDALIRLHGEVDEGFFRFKILRALGRLGAEDRGLHFDARFVEDQLAASLRRAILMKDCLASARAVRSRRSRFEHPAVELLIDTMKGKEQNAMERFFRFLAIRHPEQGVHDIYNGLMSEDGRVRAGSRELLEDILEGPLRYAALALVDDLPDEDILARSAYFFDPSAGFNPLDVEAAFMLRVRAMLGSSSETVRLVTRYVVEQLDLDADADADDEAAAPQASSEPVREGA